MSTSRRSFVVGCSAAIAAMAGGRVGDLVFASPFEPQAATNDILVIVFLRGGCDGLNLVTPFDDPIYVSARGDLRVPDSGTNKALPLTPQNATFTGGIGLHPKAAPIKELYDAGRLAIVHACGLNDDTRSHFDAMDYIERGTPGNKTTSSGWITRHLLSTQADGTLPALAAAPALPAMLLSSGAAVSMTDAKSYGLSSPYRYSSAAYDLLKKLYVGTGALDLAGRRTIETIDALKSKNLNYTPEAGVTYPEGSPAGGFGGALKLVAQIIKLDMGLKVATVDFGGWDTHENQGNNGAGYFGNMVDGLARGLQAFYNDLPNHQGRLTVVVMSEFGRRLGGNASGGTDHGHGNVMLVLGGKVNGGKIYGQWPGLEDLDQQQDLKITTDYRTILSEILVRRLANPKLGVVFPQLTAYNPLGVVQGTDLPIDFSTGGLINYLPVIER